MTTGTLTTCPAPQGLTPEEAFQEVHALLTEFPELHYQGRWEYDNADTTRCGTTRCLAGWAVWVQARRLGLLTRKRDLTSYDVRWAVAASVGIDLSRSTVAYAGDAYYTRVSAAILGLSWDAASSLFFDLDDKRVTARVKSFALTRVDLSHEAIVAFGTPTGDDDA